MSLTIEQAQDFFENTKIRKLLQSMIDVGLGYMTLGQPTSTLSGGGEVIYEGTPEKIVRCDKSKTGKYLSN